MKLICQIPPIVKLDPTINQLTNCRKLSLSTNAIEKMVGLQLRNLEILSLGRNNIKKITGLEEVGATLRELWISYNFIDRLDGLTPCNALTTLFIACNKIKAIDEVGKLANLPNISNVLLLGNSMYEGVGKEEIRPLIVKRCRQLQVLDGSIVSLHFLD